MTSQRVDFYREGTRLAGDLLQPAGLQAGEQIVGEPDLAPAHERWLGEWALAEHDSVAHGRFSR